MKCDLYNQLFLWRLTLEGNLRKPNYQTKKSISQSSNISRPMKDSESRELQQNDFYIIRYCGCDPSANKDYKNPEKKE